MDIIETILIGIGLAMDACAVSICKGLAVGRARLSQCAVTGLWFGIFQMLMPTIGYFLGRTFAERIDKYDHWIAFVLLALIGANMLRGSLDKDEESTSASFGFAAMLPLAVATSIDALAVGVSFSFYLDRAGLLLAVGLIGAITFVISAVSVKLGSVFGARHKQIAERVGGCILILIGAKILLEGLGRWPF